MSTINQTLIGSNQANVKLWCASIGCGFLVVVSLFWLMQVLIQNTQQSIDDTATATFLDFIRIKPIKKQNSRPKKPVQPKVIPETPDIPPMLKSDLSFDNVSPVSVNIKPSINMADSNFILAPSSGDYLPLVRIAPIYPENARRKGIEGSCIIQFDVNEQGATRNIRVIKCGSKYFHRSSIKAVARFKYQPRMVNGKAVTVKNIKTRFKYRLEDD